MPSVSKKQAHFMQAVAHNPKFAKAAGVPQSVGKEFTKADKGRKFKEGGMAESKKMMKKEVAFMKKKGAPKSMIKHEMAEESGMRRGGKVKKMAMGGRTGNMLYGAPQPRSATDRESPVEAQKRASAVADKAKAAQQRMNEVRGDSGFLGLGQRKTSRSPTDRKDNSTTVNTTNFKQTSTAKPFRAGGRIKKMADGGLSFIAKTPAPGVSATNSAMKAASSKIADNAKPSGIGSSIKGILDINNAVIDTATKALRRGQADQAHKQAVAEQFAREAKAKRYNERADRMHMPRTSPTGFDLPRGSGFGGGSGMYKKGGKVKKMATGGLAKAHKSADGIAKKGRTKAMQVKMCVGGMAKGRK